MLVGMNGITRHSIYLIAFIYPLFRLVILPYHGYARSKQWQPFLALSRPFPPTQVLIHACFPYNARPHPDSSVLLCLVIQPFDRLNDSIQTHFPADDISRLDREKISLYLSSSRNRGKRKKKKTPKNNHRCTPSEI